MVSKRRSNPHETIIEKITTEMGVQDDRVEIVIKEAKTEVSAVEIIEAEEAVSNGQGTTIEEEREAKIRGTENRENQLIRTPATMIAT